MAIDASDAFDLMVEGADQTSAYRLTIAFLAGIGVGDMSLAVTDIRIDAALTTDLPGQARVQSGQASMTASFTLSGIYRPLGQFGVDGIDESMTVSELLGPYQTDSPMYGKDLFRTPVSIDLGLYPDGANGVPELIRRFTGFVDSYVCNPDGTVDFSCIDNRSSLRNIPQIPPLVAAAPFNSGLTSEYAMDVILRASTDSAISSWPKVRAGAVLAVGMRSSVWPEVGAVYPFSVSNPKPYTFAPGKFGSALAGRNVILVPTGTVGAYCFIEAWVTPPVGGSQSSILLGVAGGANAFVTVTTTGVTVSVQNGYAAVSSHTVTIPIAGGTYVGASIVWPFGGATWSGKLYINNTAYTIPTQAVAGGNRASLMGGTVVVQPSNASSTDPGMIEAVQVTDGETAPPPNYLFTPTAIIDPALNSQTVVPAVEGDAFQTLQTIAKAELGTAGFDESGRFRFRNRNSLRASPAVRTITSTTSLKSLRIERSAASVINRAQIGYTNWSTAGSTTRIYSLATPTVVKKRSTKTMIVNLDSYVVQLATTVAVYPQGGDVTTTSYYRASVDQAGTSEHPGLNITLTQTSANKVTITLVNTTSQDAWLVSPANYTDLTVGTPVLYLGGILVTPDTEVTADYQYPPVAEGGAAGSRFGEVPYTLTGNPWIQDDDDAADLAQDIVGRSAQPVPNLTGVEIVPDPRLQLGDRVRVVDTDVTGVDDYAVIFGIGISYSASGDGSSDYSMSIDARTVTKPGGWILGVPGRSRLGVSTRI